MPFLGVVVTSLLASLLLQHTRSVPHASGIENRPARIVSKLGSEYELERSLPANGTCIYTLLDHRYLVAMHPDGTEIWRYDTADNDCHACCVTDTGEPYIACHGGWLYSLETSGKLRWKRNVFSAAELAYKQGNGSSEDAPSISAPLCDAHGNVFMLLRRRVVCYTPEGKLKYTCDLGDPPGVDFMENTVVGFQVARKGTVFVATDEASRPEGDGLRIIAPDGKLRTKAPLVGRCHADPDKEVVIDEHQPGTWTAYDYSWRKLWELEVDSQFVDFDGQGTIYALTQQGAVVAVSEATGKLVWSTWLRGDELLAGGDHPLYVLQRADSKVVALDPSTGKPLWQTGPGDEERAGALKAQEEQYGLNYAEITDPQLRPAFFLTYVYADSNGDVYFEGTGQWLFAADGR